MRSDGAGELYIAPLTDFNVSLSDQTGAHMVLCPQCWLLTKAGTSFFVAEVWLFVVFRKRERERVERETRDNH